MRNVLFKFLVFLCLEFMSATWWLLSFFVENRNNNNKIHFPFNVLRIKKMFFSDLTTTT